MSPVPLAVPQRAGAPIHHRLLRNGTELRVDQDVWLCVLDLALAQGWKPAGVEPAGHSYVVPRNQKVTTQDAIELARCLSEALKTVPDEVAPLSDQPFGDENTLALLSAAASGPPEPDRVAAAREILSGPPKAEATALIEFLFGGGFTITAGKKR